MPFTVQDTALRDVKLLNITRFDDARGWFIEAHKHSDFTAAGIEAQFVQDNCSRSSRGVLRGLHFQLPPHEQGKLILPLEGRLYDVALDLRTGSPSYNRWQAFTLDAATPQALWIPPGFAHGFLVLSETALFLYKVTAEYAPGHEGGIRWDDPDLGIEWPQRQPVLSPKDTALPLLKDFCSPFVYGSAAGKEKGV
ncbi:MAG: dTDP-4-dehydrorhamnose 3,5-epimerase [Candidatus Cloacimonetes bacterium]|nr:dTDP-4-dehydrorhamnose 3,5-epimerase [Candidatus Cloacimonadota bacterium]